MTDRRATGPVLECHDACLILPQLNAEDYRQLRLSIRQGFDPRHPIILCDGRILDGRHRYLACCDESVEPVFETYACGDPFAFVWQENGAIRSYGSQEQKALCRLALIDRSTLWQQTRNRIHAAANRKRSAAIKENSNAAKTLAKRGKTVLPQCEVVPDKDHRKGASALADLIGVHRPAVERARFIQDHAPQLAEQVRTGAVKAADAIRSIRRDRLRTEMDAIAAREIEQPTGLYDVIVVDPPWPMQKIELDVRPNEVGLDYPTMTLEQIRAIDLPAAEHCHLWLWTTHYFLPHAIAILAEWDLKYTCTFVWHKPGGPQPLNLPQYNCEFALYARKGNPTFLDTRALPVCFDARRGKHSEKPVEFYSMVSRATCGRRLDMFARRKIDGFTGWGQGAAP